MNLNGWSDSITSDMTRYNAPLERIYRRVWRKGGSINPFLELGFLIVSSMVMWHFKSKLGLGGGGGAEEEEVGGVGLDGWIGAAMGGGEAVASPPRRTTTEEHESPSISEPSVALSSPPS